MKVLYKTPKGTQDFSPIEQQLRNELVTKCVNQFKLFGAQPIDTPTFEREDVLMEKYNDDNTKEIFRLESDIGGDDIDSGGSSVEKLALRYDLTVPFSRYVKTTGLLKIKRYQVGKVFRKDTPNFSSGRYREFMQCDYDYLDSNCDSDLADAETLTLLNSILQSLIGDAYVIRLNNKNILFGLLEYCGVPIELYQTICSTIDKLDKRKWKDLVPEFTEKGLSDTNILKLKETFDQYKNISWDDIQTIPFVSDKTKESFAKLYKYLMLLCPDKLNKINIDLTMARGLDYYTGIIFEVNLSSNKKKAKFGSIAGGGRYDKLCNIPCVGFSIGIDRIASTLNQINKRLINPDVWIIQVGDSDEKLYEYRISLLSKLRSSDISVGTELRPNIGMGPQMNYANKNKIPYVIFVGTDEMDNNVVTLKDMDARKQTYMIPLENVITIISDGNN